MAMTDTELEQEVRDFTDVEKTQVDEIEFANVLNDAKRHIRTRRSLIEGDVDWYDGAKKEEALNWTTKLFLKVATGELDSQNVQAGAIDAKTLLAKDDNQLTVWYRNSERAIKGISADSTYGHRMTGRRTYGDE